MYYLVTGNEGQVRRFVQVMENQRIFTIRGDRNKCWVNGGDHDFVRKISSEVGTKSETVEELPKFQVMPCGRRIHDHGARFHAPNCKSCRSIEGKQALGKRLPKGQGKKSKLTTLVKIPEAPSLDLNGAITMLENIQSEAFEIASKAESITTSVKSMVDSRERLKKLQDELERSTKALEFFLKDKN
jgi:hypothetical protein